MDKITGSRDYESKPKIFVEDGKIYFSKKTERTIFFIMTLAMLIWGILTKVGLL